MRLQLSMLLLPITDRVNFWATKFISFVALEQLNMPNDFVASRSLATANPAGRAVERLVPRSRPQPAVVPDERLRQPHLLAHRAHLPGEQLPSPTVRWAL